MMVLKAVLVVPTWDVVVVTPVFGNFGGSAVGNSGDLIAGEVSLSRDELQAPAALQLG